MSPVRSKIKTIATTAILAAAMTLSTSPASAQDSAEKTTIPERKSRRKAASGLNLEEKLKSAPEIEVNRAKNRVGHVSLNTLNTLSRRDLTENTAVAVLSVLAPEIGEPFVLPEETPETWVIQRNIIKEIEDIYAKGEENGGKKNFSAEDIIYAETRYIQSIVKIARMKNEVEEDEKLTPILRKVMGNEIKIFERNARELKQEIQSKKKELGIPIEPKPRKKQKDSSPAPFYNAPEGIYDELVRNKTLVEKQKYKRARS